MPHVRKSHAQTVRQSRHSIGDGGCPPPHTVLHGVRAPERQRNGDLVVPFVNAAGETYGLRATRQAWLEFARAILKATQRDPAPRKLPAVRAPKLKPSGRLL